VKIKLKRAYDPVEPQDGPRFLVERLWPRGVSKERAHLAGWLKELAPSPELRQWYQHDLARWPEFRRRYLEELAQSGKRPLLARIREAGRQAGTVTLVLAASDPQHSSALVLQGFLEGQDRHPDQAET
jgi:uncharacterized protein YeaO (DUF488 family)